MLFELRSASLENFVEMHICNPHPRLTELETLGEGKNDLCFKQPFRSF